MSKDDKPMTDAEFVKRMQFAWQHASYDEREAIHNLLIKMFDLKTVRRIKGRLIPAGDVIL